jgi:glutamate racemase
VLGCTHYPVVKSFIESIVPPHVKVVAQGKIIADSLADYLQRHPEIEVNCQKNGQVVYLTSENTDVFDQNASSFVKDEVKSSHVSLH